ncbi:MAG: deoxyribonuclease IV [Candidatus Promineifilaceae bacterium]
MRLGAQVSTAGGLFKAFERGHDLGCESIMVFTKSNRQWKAKPLLDDDIQKFQAKGAEFANIHPVAIHASYLINVGSPEEELWEKSYQSLKVEVERADVLSIPLLTFHPGAHMNTGEEAGLENIARALRRLLRETDGSETMVCLETTAGTGTTLGYRFEHLAYLLQNGQEANQSGRLGVCLDTCHIYAAGYDIRTPDAYRNTMEEFDAVVGLDEIKCFHFNDSKYELGKRGDRHAHIGEGAIGLDGFANFVNDPRWSEHPAHLETAKKEETDDGEEIEMDPVNLDTLRKLIR